MRRVDQLGGNSVFHGLCEQKILLHRLFQEYVHCLYHSCWILVLQATDNIEYIVYGEYESDPFWYIENPNLVFPGFLFTSVITLIIIWPMAYFIRSIPGFSQVL
jgi:hypothetical protein